MKDASLIYPPTKTYCKPSYCCILFVGKPLLLLSKQFKYPNIKTAFKTINTLIEFLNNASFRHLFVRVQ